MWDLIKDFAALSGWFPIACGSIIAMLLGKFFYDRELSVRDQRIAHLKDEIENGKAYQFDAIYQRLTQKVKDLHEERDLLNSEKDIKQDEIEQVNKDLEIAYSEIRELQNNIKQYDLQLDDLLSNELDICRVCTVDEERVMMNTIYWGGKSGKLIGDTDLVEEGVCSYCASINLKCKVCGGITGIDANATDVIECEGCYDTLYTPSSFFGEKLEDTIKVSRRLSE